jgi:CheY-like chemotaxis protein
VQDLEAAVDELSRSPAQALFVNSPACAEGSDSVDRLADLPYGTPTISCWVPGENDAANHLGVVRYLLKPITCETLLSALEDLGQDIRTVLLVDDEPEMLRLFARMLASSSREYRILQTTSGQRALSLLRDRHPDVLLLDLIMPGLDGFQVLQAKGQDPTIAEIPTIVISARDPSGEPIVSNTLAVTRGGGLSVRELYDCIRAISEILAPSVQPARRERQPDGRASPERTLA